MCNLRLLVGPGAPGEGWARKCWLLCVE